MGEPHWNKALCTLYNIVSAWKENGRRTVLEMSLATEAMVKRRIFGGDVAANVAFEHLADKGKLNFRVVDLLHSTAKKVYGESFLNPSPSGHEHPDYLFRARNKVAHRRKAIFRYDNGNLHVVDSAMLHRWWDEGTTLYSWLWSKHYNPYTALNHFRAARAPVRRVNSLTAHGPNAHIAAGELPHVMGLV